MAVSSKYTQGIQIEFGGNATGLKTALNEINKAAKTTQGELTALKNGLKLEWNPDNFKRAQELAQRLLQQTNEKAAVLKQALAQLDQQGSNKNAEQYEALRRELSYVQISAQAAQKELSELNRSQFSELESSAKRLSQDIANAKDAVSATAAELEAMKSKLNVKWDVDTFTQAQALATQSVQETAHYAELLKEKMRQMKDAGPDGDTLGAYQRLRQELAGAEASAQAAQRELAALSRIRLDALSKELETAGSRLNTMGNHMTMGLTAPLAAAGVASVGYASDTVESINKVDVAFGDSALGVKKWSEDTLTAYGLARGTALDMAAQFGDMATAMGFGQEKAADMSKALVGLAGDMASFKNMSIDQVKTALSGIFTGESEAMKNLGIIITETNMKAYALSQGIEKNFESFTQAEKVALRYQYVLEASANSQGDFARTSDETANQLRIFQESLKEAAATAGGELLPIITPMVAQLSQLTQSFGAMDEKTQKLVVQTALFLATLGPAMKLTGGLTATVSAAATALGVLKAALVAKQAADVGATASQTALNVAMTANPVGAIATAIGALVAALGAFILTTVLTKEHVDALTDSLQASKQAYVEATAVLEEQRADTMGMVAALETLEEAEFKTAAQKETMLSLVEQLNETVPGLSLAYDQLSGQLNMTTEDIRALAVAAVEEDDRQAAVERLTEVYKNQAMITNELAAETAALERAEQEKQKVLDSSIYGTVGYSETIMAADAAVLGARKRISDLTIAQKDNDAELVSLEQQYGKYEEKTRDATASTVLFSGATAKTEQELAALKAATEQQTTATQTLISETEILSSALSEQSKNGGLSLDTALKLIDAGYAAALSVDKETGAVRLNAEIYREVAKAKLEEQIAALESQRISVNSALQLKQEAEAAVAAATGYLELAKAKKKAADDQTPGSLSELEAQSKSLEAQIAALKALKNNIGKLSFGSSGSSGGSGGSGSHKGSSGSKRPAKSEAERMVEAYKKAMEELEYLRDMGEVSEADYFERLAALRDAYLKKDSDEWRAATVTLHHWENEENERTAQENEKVFNEKLDDLKYFRSMDLISEEEYYAQLEQLRDIYLAENSDAWRDANVQLHEYREQCREQELADAEAAFKEQMDAFKEQLDAELDTLKDGLDAELGTLKEGLKKETEALKESLRIDLEARKDQYDKSKDAAKAAFAAQRDAAKTAFEEKKAAIRQELALEKERLNAVIDGIDKEIQARRELREDEGQEDAISAAQKRLDVAKTQRDYARTDEDRAEWDKEIIRLKAALEKAVQEKEDTAFFREKELEKEAVKDQITVAEDTADTDLKRVEKEYDVVLGDLEHKYADTLLSLEETYQADIERLKADYVRQEESLKADYARRVEELKADYARREAELRETYRQMEKEAQAAHEKKLEEIAAANQENAFEYGKDLGAILKGAVDAAVGSVTHVSNQVSKQNSASVNIYQASALTEGQVANTVRKVLNILDR